VLKYDDRLVGQSSLCFLVAFRSQNEYCQLEILQHVMSDHSRFTKQLIVSVIEEFSYCRHVWFTLSSRFAGGEMSPVCERELRRHALRAVSLPSVSHGRHHGVTTWTGHGCVILSNRRPIVDWNTTVLSASVFSLVIVFIVIMLIYY